MFRSSFFGPLLIFLCPLLLVRPPFALWQCKAEQKDWMKWVGDVDQGDQGGPFQQKDVLAKPNRLLMDWQRPDPGPESDPFPLFCPVPDRYCFVVLSCRWLFYLFFLALAAHRRPLHGIDSWHISSRWLKRAAPCGSVQLDHNA